jgi:RNA polymerase sigma factor (sigma-70 family)
MIDERSSSPTRRDRFEQIAAEVYEPVQRYIRRRARADLVDDIVSDTMMTLWRRLDDVPPQAVLPYSYGVARRSLANARRADGRHLRLVRRIGAEPRPQPASSNPLDPELHTALEQLPQSDREILRLWAWEGLEPGEIATALGLTPNAASIRLHRAKKKLGENLEHARKIDGPSGHSHDEQRKEER